VEVWVGVLEKSRKRSELVRVVWRERVLGVRGYIK